MVIDWSLSVLVIVDKKLYKIFDVFVNNWLKEIVAVFWFSFGNCIVLICCLDSVFREQIKSICVIYKTTDVIVILTLLVFTLMLWYPSATKVDCGIKKTIVDCVYWPTNPKNDISFDVRGVQINAVCCHAECISTLRPILLCTIRITHLRTVRVGTLNSMSRVKRVSRFLHTKNQCSNPFRFPYVTSCKQYFSPYPIYSHFLMAIRNFQYDHWRIMNEMRQQINFQHQNSPIINIVNGHKKR